MSRGPGAQPVREAGNARDFGGLVGRYKLDWFFAKPCIPRPQGEGMG